MQNIAKITSFLLLSGALLIGSPALAYGRNITHQISAVQIQNSSVSANWSGYVADTAQNYTAVGATWAVPSPSATSGSGISTDATWVGVGGVQSTDLIQAGTQALLQRGQIQYQAWYELLPDYQQIIPLTVSGGDSVTVNITNIGTDLWHISFKDNTTGGDYEQNVNYDSSMSSAEWIEEMPVIEEGRGMSYLPLDNFGVVQFTGGYTVASGARETIAGAGAVPLTMGTRTQALATPSTLADDSFSVTRSAAQSQSPDTQQIAYTGGRGSRRGSGGGFSISSPSGQQIIVVTFR